MAGEHSLPEGVEQLSDLLHEAREAYARQDPSGVPYTDGLLTRIQLGQFEGRWIERDGRAQGLIVWTRVTAVGSEVVFWYASPGPEPLAGWTALLRAALEAGPVRLIPGELPGLPPEEEARLLGEAGFARYHRYELQFPPDAPLPGRSSPLDPLRPVRPSDKAGLAHLTQIAYAGGLDQYLFQTATDPVDDAREQIEILFSGEYGPIDAHASNVWTEGNLLRGAVLVTRRDAGALIISVMVDPAAQGQGIGRRLLVRAIESLRAEGEPRIFLNVTGGNRPALHLYRALGFRRSLGPKFGWYSRRLVPVPPTGAEPEEEWR
ncbi:MAG: GNAT family N-acetyltransferase [Thermoplasmata archaeon]|jgi:GNAT superfamily N-acetyltransferase